MFLKIVTAFTIGHSITLLGSVYDFAPAGAWFPPLVETLIAVSIVYMALEKYSRRRPSSSMADCLALRSCSWIRVRLWVERGLTIRREASSGLAVLVQCRHRDRTDPRPRAHAAGAGRPPAARARRAHRYDDPVGDRGSRRLALDDRARRRAVEGRVAAARRGRPRGSRAVGRRAPSCSGRRQVLREASAYGTRNRAPVPGGDELAGGSRRRRSGVSARM